MVLYRDPALGFSVLFHLLVSPKLVLTINSPWKPSAPPRLTFRLCICPSRCCHDVPRPDISTSLYILHRTSSSLHPSPSNPTTLSPRLSRPPVRLQLLSTWYAGSPPVPSRCSVAALDRHHMLALTPPHNSIHRFTSFHPPWELLVQLQPSLDAFASRAHPGLAARLGGQRWSLGHVGNPTPWRPLRASSSIRTASIPTN